MHFKKCQEIWQKNIFTSIFSPNTEIQLSTIWIQVVSVSKLTSHKLNKMYLNSCGLFFHNHLWCGRNKSSIHRVRFKQYYGSAGFNRCWCPTKVSPVSAGHVLLGVIFLWITSVLSPLSSIPHLQSWRLCSAPVWCPPEGPGKTEGSHSNSGNRVWRGSCKILCDLLIRKCNPQDQLVI